MKKNLLIAALLIATTGGLLAADAKENWEKNCQKCHGPDGKGNTRMGKQSGVKDYSDAKVQQDLKDDKALQAIKDGLVEKGKKKMDAYSAKLTEDEMKALVAYMRGFKK